MKNRKNSVYETGDGRTMGFNSTNRHHIVFNGSEYVGPHFKQHPDRELLRAYRGLIVIRMPIDDHIRLHNSVEPPLFPSKATMAKLVDLNKEMHQLDPLERLVETIDYLGQVALQGESAAHINETLFLADNFKRQARILEPSAVVLLDEK